MILFIFFLFGTESTFPSRICSSAPLVYFLFICPFVILLFLLISLLCLYCKAKKLSALSLSVQKEQSLWVNLKGAGGWTTNRMGDNHDEDSWILRGAHKEERLWNWTAQDRRAPWFCPSLSLWPGINYPGLRGNMYWACLWFQKQLRVSLYFI